MKRKMSNEFLDIAYCGNCIYRDEKEGVCKIKPRLDDKGNTLEEKAKVDINEKGCADFTEKEKIDIVEVYRNLVDIFKEWCDLKESYYNIIALWVIGTYLHKYFPSYPYLFFNAMKGSGKSRILKLITYLSKDGALLNSLTETELFRSKGTLGIDEFEGINKKGEDNLRELLNSGYKKGTKVRRMKKVKTKEGEDYEVEEFDVYRPILMANIAGMEDVLSDRCINLILEKSEKEKITNLIEIFETDDKIKKTKELLEKIVPLEIGDSTGTFPVCRLCYVVSKKNIYKEWNSYILHNNTHNTHNTHTSNSINYFLLFKRIKEAHINGRELELSFPLFLISYEIGKNELETTLSTLAEIMREKREESLVENRDISLYDFLSQEEDVTYFLSLNELNRKFRDFLQTNDDDINLKWMGRALKRLNLIIEKRRKTKGVEVKLNFKKAQTKIKMFK